MCRAGGLANANPFLVVGMFQTYGFELTAIPAPIRWYVQAAAQAIGKLLGFKWHYEEYRSAGGMAKSGYEERSRGSSSERVLEDPATAASHAEL